MLKRKQEIEIAIEKLAFGGQGIGHVQDFVVFVENVLPGDRVKAFVHKTRKNYAEAYPIEIIKPSKLRIQAPCQHFGTCGGCKWQNMDYELQLRFKEQHVKECLEHIGGISPPIIYSTIPSPRIFGYRNKMEFSFSGNRWLTPEELQNPEIEKGFAIGFHIPRFFNRVVDIQKCWLQSDLLNDILAFSKEYFSHTGIPVFNLRSHEGILRYLVLRESFAFNQVMVNVVTFEPIPEKLTDYAEQLVKRFPQIVSVLNNVNSRFAQIALGDTEFLIYGRSSIQERVGDFCYEISANSFFQTNSLQAENLYKIIRKFAEIDNSTVWDLYCGTGGIAIFLSRRARKIRGFDIVESAIQDARKNARINEVHNCEFVCGDLRFNINKFIEEQPEVIICDPPRSGMHKDVVKGILKVNPKRIIYVSCNPATMARDLDLFTQKYRLVACQPIDMFPHTHHIESVVKLVKA